MLTDFQVNVANETQREQVLVVLGSGFPSQVGLRYKPEVDYLSVLLDLAEHHKTRAQQRLITKIPLMAVSILSGVAPHIWRSDIEHPLELNFGVDMDTLPEEGRAYVQKMGTRLIQNIKRLLGGGSELLVDVTPIQDFEKSHL
jgi:hypothetical protein